MTNNCIMISCLKNGVLGKKSQLSHTNIILNLFHSRRNFFFIELQVYKVTIISFRNDKKKPEQLHWRVYLHTSIWNQFLSLQSQIAITEKSLQCFPCEDYII